ncbi:hypothetical protein [Cohnella lupini]|nr:hypothetical protein [Cohnella lupini]
MFFKLPKLAYFRLIVLTIGAKHSDRIGIELASALNIPINRV